MWGKRAGGFADVPGLWFTPTGVGKTHCMWLRHCTHLVHPHRCGENFHRVFPVGSGFGSPPQVWGKRRGRWSHRCHSRFTPTGVGKTKRKRKRKEMSGVHPHRCGENTTRTIGIVPLYGSPPQVWGKLCAAACSAMSAWFTPTGVGKTTSVKVAMSWVAVHPHRCGENGPAGRFFRKPQGSPPQVWGKHRYPILNTRRVRFTPTGVGKTLQGGGGGWSRRVHPHRCGENIRSTLAGIP